MMSFRIGPSDSYESFDIVFEAASLDDVAPGVFVRRSVLEAARERVDRAKRAAKRKSA